MIMVILFFMFILFYELNYLRKKNRKKRTYWIVLIVMSVSFLYCLSAVVMKDFPSPNIMIQFLFKPLQDRIIG